VDQAAHACPILLLYPSILVFMAIGVYSPVEQRFDVLIQKWRCVGDPRYICVKLECEPAPDDLGFILGR